MLQWCKERKFLVTAVIWFCVVVLVSFILIIDRAKQVDYPTFNNILKENLIKEISLSSTYMYVYKADGEIYKVSTRDIVLCTRMIENSYHKGEIIHDEKCQLYLSFKYGNIPLVTPKTSVFTKIFYAINVFFVGLLILYVLFDESRTNKDDKYSSSDTGGDFNDLQTMSLRIEPMRSSVKLKDVAGIKEAKEDLIEIIDYLKNPKKYQDLGIYLPKGVLLVGPPGVGKTMIAKAIAGESGIPFFYQSGSSFVQVYVGVGAQRVRELFAKARANAPSIIFIDEIDAVGKARGADNHQEWETTLNELLTEMDGFSEQSGVIVIGATNQVDVMDQALLRSGRFDRRIYIDLPDLQEREEILKVHLNNRRHNLKLHEIAKICIGFSGANIASLINEAAINALRNNRQEIILQDILDTTQKVMFGKKRQNTLSMQERKALAYYNAGKGISQYWLSNDFLKITLVDVNSETSMNQKNQEYSSESELISEIKIALSGNLSLEVHGFGASTLAKHDIERAKDIARKMCEEYGMGERLITDYDDVLEILEKAKTEHKEFILSNKNYIETIAQRLMEQEKVSKGDIQKILE